MPVCGMRLSPASTMLPIVGKQSCPNSLSAARGAARRRRDPSAHSRHARQTRVRPRQSGRHARPGATLRQSDREVRSRQKIDSNIFAYLLFSLLVASPLARAAGRAAVAAAAIDDQQHARAHTAPESRRLWR